MSTTFYVNLFHNDFFQYTGFKKKLEPAQEGGVRPVIVPTSNKLLKSVMTTAVRFPYRLEDKNIRKFDVGRFTVAFLVPTRDVPNLTDSEYENSLYYKLTGTDEQRKEELEQKLEEKQDIIGRLRKEKRELQEEEEEQGKGGSLHSERTLICPECGQSNSESRWENNSGLCPSCQRVSMDDPEVNVS